MIDARLTKNNFAALKKQLREKVNRQVLKSAQDAAVLARALCPVSAKDHADGSPHLRDTIVVTRTIDGAVQIVVGDPAAVYVEYGTHNMAAQPFLTPAIEQMKLDLKTKLNGILEKGGQV